MYDVDPEFIKQLETYARNIKEDKIMSKVEEMLIKGLIMSTVDMLANGVDHEMDLADQSHIEDFANKFIRRCKENELSETKAFVFFIEVLCDLSGMLKEGQDE